MGAQLRPPRKPTFSNSSLLHTPCHWVHALASPLFFAPPGVACPLQVLAVNLNACFLKLVLRRPVTLDDIADLDDAVYRSLKCDHSI